MSHLHSVYYLHLVICQNFHQNSVFCYKLVRRFLCDYICTYMILLQKTTDCFTSNGYFVPRCDLIIIKIYIYIYIRSTCTFGKWDYSHYISCLALYVSVNVIELCKIFTNQVKETCLVVNIYILYIYIELLGKITKLVPELLRQKAEFLIFPLKFRKCLCLGK